MNFSQKLDAIITKNNSLVCVGLDSDINKLPEHLKNLEYPQFEFNKKIIEATSNLVCAYKPNSAFYEARGDRGVGELKMTCDFLSSNYPDIPIIIDAKRGDIGNTNNGYIQFAFDYLNVDAITLHPYLGREAIQPFLDRKDKGIIILCKTSNPGAQEFQDLTVILEGSKSRPIESLKKDPIASLQDDNKINPSTIPQDYTSPLYQYVAQKVVNEWNTNNNCLLVIGATYPEELSITRKIAKDMTFLIPGIGAQGGDVEKTVKAGLNSQKKGMIINSSRGIIFAGTDTDFAEKAREETQKLQKEINIFRE